MASVAGIARRITTLGEMAFDMNANYQSFLKEKEQFDAMADRKSEQELLNAQRRLTNYRHVLFAETRDSLIEKMEKILHDIKDSAFDKEWE